MQHDPRIARHRARNVAKNDERRCANALAGIAQRNARMAGSERPAQRIAHIDGRAMRGGFETPGLHGCDRQAHMRDDGLRLRQLLLRHRFEIHGADDIRIREGVGGVLFGQRLAAGLDLGTLG